MQHLLLIRGTKVKLVLVVGENTNNGSNGSNTKKDGNGKCRQKQEGSQLIWAIVAQAKQKRQLQIRAAAFCYSTLNALRNYKFFSTKSVILVNRCMRVLPP